MPPLLPTYFPWFNPQFQAVSDTYEPPGPVVVRVVPPTCVIFVLSDGNGMRPVKASESPVALKNECPWGAIGKKSCYGDGSGLPPPQEQPICLAMLSFAMRLRISTQGLGLGAS